MLMKEALDYIDEVCEEAIEIAKIDAVHVEEEPEKYTDTYKNYVTSYSDDFMRALMRAFSLFKIVIWKYKEAEKDEFFDGKEAPKMLYYAYISKPTFPMLLSLYKTIIQLKKDILEKEKNILYKALDVNGHYINNYDIAPCLMMAFEDLQEEQVAFYEELVGRPITNKMVERIEEREFKYCESKFVKESLCKIVDELDECSFSSVNTFQSGCFKIFRKANEVKELKGCLNELSLSFSNMSENVFKTTSVHFKYWTASLAELRKENLICYNYNMMSDLTTKLMDTWVFRSETNGDLFIIARVGDTAKNCMTFVSFKVNFHKKKYNFYMLGKMFQKLLVGEGQSVEDAYNKIEKMYGQYR